MKSVNDFVKSWAEKLSPRLLADTVARDVLKGVEMYNYNLTWDQIDLLEQALGDLVVRRYHNRDTNAELLSILGFILACGTANQKH